MERSLVIRADDLSRRFGRHWAVSGVSLRLAAGRSLLITGHNGAGKTTLMRLLSTMLMPTAGRMWIAGADARTDLAAARTHIGMVADRNGLYADLSALDNLLLVAHLAGIDDPNARCHAALTRVGLQDHAQASAGQFSSGMRRRLAYARLLLQQPSLVLLDEPYAGLDREGMNFVDRLVAELLEDKRAVVIITHHVARAAQVSHHGLLLDHGQPAWTGPAADLPRAFEADA